MVDSWLGSTAALVWVLCNLQLLVTPATLRTEGVVRIGQFFMHISQIFQELLEAGVSILSEVP